MEKAIIEQLYQDMQGDKRLSFKQRHLLSRIAYRSTHTGYCCDTNRDFVNYFKRRKNPMQVDARTIQRWIQALVHKKYLLREVEGNKRFLSFNLEKFPYMSPTQHDTMSPSINVENDCKQEQSQKKVSPSQTNAMTQARQEGDRSTTGARQEHDSVSPSQSSGDTHGNRQRQDFLSSPPDTETKTEIEFEKKKGFAQEAAPTHSPISKWGKEAGRLIVLYLRPDSASWTLQANTCHHLSRIQDGLQLADFTQWLQLKAETDRVTGKVGFNPADVGGVMEAFDRENAKRNEQPREQQPQQRKPSLAKSRSKSKPEPKPLQPIEPGNSGQIDQALHEQLEKRINRPSYNTWLRPVSLMSMTDDKAVFGVPNETFVYWLNEHYHYVITDELESLTGKKLTTIEFEVRASKEPVLLPRQPLKVPIKQPPTADIADDRLLRLARKAVNF